jgi:plasmid maintenance system antidote protein VapI
MDAWQTSSAVAGDALATIRLAYESMAAEVERAPDAVRAFATATELRNELDRLVQEAALLRARMACRVQASEGLSLAALASRLGVSKARADQLVRTATGRRGDRTTRASVDESSTAS